jgi:RNA polymerase sigma-70 factor (ECF subfamily)
MEADVTTLLGRWREAFDALMPLVYDELHRRARRYLRGEREGHTLSTRALVNEAYVALVDINKVDWQDRTHFYAMAARAMRRILVSYARRHHATKRGGGETHVALDDLLVDAADHSARMLEVHAALDKLAAVDERLARLVELRFFGGLTFEEIAEVLGLGLTTVKLDWRKARAWLYRELES